MTLQATNEKNWLAFYTKPRQEFKTAELFGNLSIEYYLPTIITLRQWSDRKKKVRVPLFNGYVFARVDEKERLYAVQQESVVKVVSFSGKPSIVPEWQIESLKKMLLDTPDVFVTHGLQTGQQVKITEGPFGGVIGTILAFIWLLTMIYTTKLLDGLDGLASGITMIASVLIFIVSLFWDVAFSGTSVLALIVAGATLGFLIFNWHPAKIFLGEGGSVFCGYILGVLAIISGSKIATALLIMGIPILDVVWVVVRRLFFGSGIARGDRKHLHFRLLEIGLTHSQAVIFLYIITTAFGLASLFLASSGKVIALVVLALFMIILVSCLFMIYQYKTNKN